MGKYSKLSTIVIFLFAKSLILRGALSQEKYCTVQRSLQGSSKTSLKCTGFTSIPNEEERKIRPSTGTVSFLPIPSTTTLSPSSSSSSGSGESFTSLLLGEGNSIEELEDNIFLHAKTPPSLEYLELENCNIQNISPDAFQGGQNLARLSLAQNKLEILNPQIFKYLNKLTFLNLAGNPLKPFHPGTIFPDLPHLTKLDLKSCSITHLEIGLFKNLLSLENIDLSNNSLSTLDWQMLKPLSKLERILLSENPWHCDCRLGFLLDFLDEKINPFLSFIDSLRCTSGTKVIPFSNSSSNEDPEADSFSVIGVNWSELRARKLSCTPNVTIIRSEGHPLLLQTEEDLIIECEYSGVPEPEIIWMRNNSVLELKQYARMEAMKIETGNEHIEDKYANYTLNYGQRLTIKQVALEDAGTYQCWASNLNGNAISKTFQVNVTHAQVTPTTITVKPEVTTTTATEIVHDETSSASALPGEGDADGNRHGRKLGETETSPSSHKENEGKRTEGGDGDGEIPGWLCILLGAVAFLFIIGLFGGICIWRGRKRDTREVAMNEFVRSRFANASYMRKKLKAQPPITTHTEEANMEEGETSLRVQENNGRRGVEHVEITSFLTDITKEWDAIINEEEDTNALQ